MTSMSCPCRRNSRARTERTSQHFSPLTLFHGRREHGVLRLKAGQSSREATSLIRLRLLGHQTLDLAVVDLARTQDRQ